MQHFVGNPNFLEGVRARLIDKDHAPRWEPPTLEGVTDAMVDAFFQPAAEKLTFSEVRVVLNESFHAVWGHGEVESELDEGDPSEAYVPSNHAGGDEMQNVDLKTNATSAQT